MTPLLADPVIQTRDQHLRAQGQTPFLTEHLPTAVLALKQGAGRLIRDSTDRGMLVIGDRRLRTKGYGGTFLGSLPEMRQVDDLGCLRESVNDSIRIDHLLE